MNRRKFLKGSGMAAASIAFPTIVPSSVFGKYAPSNRIGIGMIGLGRQGYGQNLQGTNLSAQTRIPGFLDIPDVQVIGLCDVDSWRLNKAKEVVNQFYSGKKGKKNYKGCAVYSDFRELLEMKSIDAVMISTPDFWHVPMGILAAEKGKHISCEKPLSMSVQQGRSLVNALAQYNVINRTDSEFRSIRQQNRAVELVRNQKIGTLRKIEVSFPADPSPIHTQADMTVPKELNYDLWLGPSEFVPYTEKRVHPRHDLDSRPGWMRVNEYAQGMIANWGAHYFDLAQWANNSENSGPVEVEGKGEFPNSPWNTMINFNVTFRYANGVELVCHQSGQSIPSIKYTGSEGWIFVEGFPGMTTAGDPAILNSKVSESQLDLSATQWDKLDFINAIKNNKPTLEPIETGHRTISISQIGLIACQIGEKLKWDPGKELFEGNDAANKLLEASPARKEWAM